MKNLERNKIVILTGAGISAESGIKTFRDQNGLWENHAIEDVASPEGFRRNPPLVYDFYNARRTQLYSDEVKENEGHLALAKLVKDFKGEVTLITQNVDDLHERAGRNFGLPDSHVLHMHGELSKMRCQKTNLVFQAPTTFDGLDLCDCCREKGNLRPHIVWFGEMPFYLDLAYDILPDCDLFLSVGTSGHVYPAAQFVSMTSSQCLRIEANLTGTQISSQFDKHYEGKASEVLPTLVEEILLGKI